MVNKRDLPALLAKARQQLRQAQLRVTTLEAEISEAEISETQVSEAVRPAQFDFVHFPS